MVNGAKSGDEFTARVDVGGLDNVKDALSVTGRQEPKDFVDESVERVIGAIAMKHVVRMCWQNGAYTWDSFFQCIYSAVFSVLKWKRQREDGEKRKEMVWGGCGCECGCRSK